MNALWDGETLWQNLYKTLWGRIFGRRSTRRVWSFLCVLGMYVAFPRVEFAVINYTLHDWLKFVYCSIVEAYGKSWKYTDTRYARKYN